MRFGFGAGDVRETQKNAADDSSTTTALKAAITPIGKDTMKGTGRA